ncbi:MAG TPA: TRAP transporter small permease subunit, partial [Aestuariivirgaceae bacterium]|nr:TRAP transporter small permease subunit [Aestuariivirgaceae bacterium]
DVVSRYYGVPKPFGLNSTQVQESEYWLHSILFALVIGYAYIRQAHVRIDLVRGRLPIRAKYVIEMTGCLLFLIPGAVVIAWLAIGYTVFSYTTGEVSKSVIGLSNIWILKAFLPIMYGLMVLAGISQFIKSLAGFLGRLPPHRELEALGGDH